MVEENAIVVPSAPKIKSVVVRGLFPSKPVDEGSSTAAFFPGPCLVLVSDLPKVLLLMLIHKSIPNTSFRNLSLLDIDSNIYIPEYFDDFLTLAWLAFLLPDQTKEPATSLTELDELTDEDIMEISADQFTLRNRRVVKAKEQIDDIFLRCSKGNATKHGVFKSPLNPVLEPVPLAMIPAVPQHSAPAPHLP